MTPSVEIAGPAVPGIDEVLTPEALEFVGWLHEQFEPERRRLLARRAEAPRLALDPRSPARLDLDWRVAEPAPGLVDRRVEITGPPDRKMTINALNSGAKVWMADFEDATSPTWESVIAGQVNLRAAIERRIDFDSEGKSYALRPDDELATIVVRPRGWHLDEAHLRVDGVPIAGAFVDFGLYLFHCADLQIARGQGPYFYLPKTESASEARLWNAVFVAAAERRGIDHRRIRATVLIETLPAAFQMEEILYELREHSAGLNAGRWDYLFSVIKVLGADERFVLPDRSSLTMTVPFMRAYTQLLVNTCHRRGAHAIGGMAAFIPNRRDPEATAAALDKVRADKKREAGDGFDGSWVAHPGLVEVCREEFDAVLGHQPNQLDRVPDLQTEASALVEIENTPGQCTPEGLRSNIAVGLRYLEAWLGGAGAVGIFGLMEDVATAEISRSQVWQWRRFGVTLSDGTVVTAALVDDLIDQERATIAELPGDHSRLDAAVDLFRDLVQAEEFPAFLTLSAYRELVGADA